jgi:hypothetical protein
MSSFDYDNDDDSDSSDGSGLPEITAELGLSLEVLQSLQMFQQHGCFLGEEGDDDNAAVGKDTVCVAYTAKDSQVISDTYRRLEEKAVGISSEYQASLDQLEDRIVLDLEEPDATNTTTTPNERRNSSDELANILAMDGVLRINAVLPPDLCDECLLEINNALHAADSSTNTGDEDNTGDDGAAKMLTNKDGFGNVFSRNCRYDMYLRPKGVFQQALQSMLHREAALGGLFHSSVNGEACVFHELSSLISDPGSVSQPIHPDAPFSELCPMWTVFVALQDVDAEMGPTVMLPRTNTSSVHQALKNPDSMVKLLAASEYKRCVLKKGDAAIMDARTLHFGGANLSDARRVLLYFTVRNPLHGSDDSAFPGCNSLWPDLQMTTQDYF